MNDAFLVDQLQSFAYLKRDALCLLPRHRTVPVDLFVEGDSVHVFHGQKGCRPVTAGRRKQIELMNATDLRPAHPSRQLDLLAESLECVSGGRYTVTNCFESDDAELQIFRLIDLAHSASADRANDAE